MIGINETSSIMQSYKSYTISSVLNDNIIQTEQLRIRFI